MTYDAEMRVLVTGGAGYVGSHTVLSLIEAGHEPVIVDRSVNSKPSVVPRLEALSGKGISFHRVDLADASSTDALFAAERFDAVIHFAGLKAVGDSVERPLHYYANNLGSTVSLLQAMGRHGVDRLICSSSATVYGEQAPVPYPEDYEPLSASSPYGQTKVMIERILADVATASSLKVAILRFFNPVGAHSSGEIGEDPQGTPNNLMPFVAQVAVGRREKLHVYGDDYPTADGTCERDYIHVEDLASGHVAALDNLEQMREPLRAFNLGSGQGTSVLEVLHAFERACGKTLPYEVVGRRAGDLPAYWADTTRASEELGWTSKRTIDDICIDTWRWQSRNPQGFPDA